MSIGVGIIIFIIGCYVGYMIRLASWIKEANDIQMKIDRLVAEMKRKDDGNDD